MCEAFRLWSSQLATQQFALLQLVERKKSTGSLTALLEKCCGHRAFRGDCMKNIKIISQRSVLQYWPIGQWELFTKNRFLRSPKLKLQTLCERIITDIQMYSNFECLLQTSAEISLRLRSQMVKMQIARSSATRSASSKMVKTLKIVPRIYLKESI